MEAWNTPVGIIGAGMMGAGIAQRLVESGITVILVGRDSQKFGALRLTLAQNAKLSLRRKRAEAGAIERGLADLVITDDLKRLNGCGIILEAIAEDLTAKVSLYKSLQPHLKADAILCTNTSSLSVKDLARESGLAERFLGLHFMNPAATSPMAELIRQPGVSPEHLDTVRAFAKGIGLTLVELEDTPGFIVNRLLMAMIVQAVNLLQANVASTEAIDTAMRLGCAHPLGPLALADMIGLDVVLAELEELHGKLGESYAPPARLQKLVAAGHLGRKTGRGFLSYGK
ncbi:MAG: NAD(P)-binding domain-containing protein [Planctomycetes bacterium]|nr:NAD(P)-binding domain-containing protein [Planctomycetota bacterium]